MYMALVLFQILRFASLPLASLYLRRLKTKLPESSSIFTVHESDQFHAFKYSWASTS